MIQPATRYTVTIREEDMLEARRLCFSMPETEGACFLLCGESRTGDEVRLLCQSVHPIADTEYLVREPDFLSLDSPCYVAAAKQARESGLSLVFVHSHPGGYPEFSEQDDREEPKLQEFFATRIPNRTHGSLVLTPDGVFGRVWDDGFQELEVVRVIGNRFAFYQSGKESNAIPEFFDRQVRAFGPEIQSVLSRLHIGIVGAGGTGSAVFEQLTRLGVGIISVFDEDVLESTNVNRVYGSSAQDDGVSKVSIAKRNAEHIAVGADIRSYPKHITEKETALRLRECDVIFGCTDKEAPRGILCQLATRYIIPFFDTGVIINSENGHIQDITGRVTTVYPGAACLFCRGRISAEMIGYEMMPEEERAQRIKEGYAPELATSSPAVIPFTTSVAAAAVSEFLHRLTGFMGSNRHSTEVLISFDQTRISTNREIPSPRCFCGSRSLWASGDSGRFLGMWG